MSVDRRKIPSGATRYVVRWRENGRQRSRNFDRLTDANAFDAELRRLRQMGELAAQLERRRLTVNDLYVDWLERGAPLLAARTAETYAIQLDLRILPTFGSRQVAALTVADVERWIATMRADGVGDPTIIRACAVLSALLSQAVRDGMVAVNVAQQARKPKQQRTRTPRLVPPEAVERMRAHMLTKSWERDAVLLELLAYAGLRPESEALRLTWGQVRDRSLLVTATKTRSERSVQLLAPLTETLAAWRLRQGRPGANLLVVPSPDGSAWTRTQWTNWRRRRFAPAASAVGLPADTRPRDLRGSLASLLLHEGRSIVEVARALGHSPEVCLRAYAQVVDEVDPDRRVSAVDAIVTAREAVTMSAGDEREERVG